MIQPETENQSLIFIGAISEEQEKELLKDDEEWLVRQSQRKKGVLTISIKVNKDRVECCRIALTNEGWEYYSKLQKQQTIEFNNRNKNEESRSKSKEQVKSHFGLSNIWRLLRIKNVKAKTPDDKEKSDNNLKTPQIIKFDPSNKEHCNSFFKFVEAKIPSLQMNQIVSAKKHGFDFQSSKYVVPPLPYANLTEPSLNQKFKNTPNFFKADGTDNNSREINNNNGGKRPDLLAS